MKRMFADTFYRLALLDIHDHWNQRALALSKKIGHYNIVTTEEILLEVLNFKSGQGFYHREKDLKQCGQFSMTHRFL